MRRLDSLGRLVCCIGKCREFANFTWAVRSYAVYLFALAALAPDSFQHTTLAQTSRQELLSTVEGHCEVDDISAVARMTDSQRQEYILVNRTLLEKYRKKTTEERGPFIYKSFQESTV